MRKLQINDHTCSRIHKVPSLIASGADPTARQSTRQRELRVLPGAVSNYGPHGRSSVLSTIISEDAAVGEEREKISL